MRVRQNMGIKILRNPPPPPALFKYQIKCINRALVMCQVVLQALWVLGSPILSSLMVSKLWQFTAALDKVFPGWSLSDRWLWTNLLAHLSVTGNWTEHELIEIRGHSDWTHCPYLGIGACLWCGPELFGTPGEMSCVQNQALKSSGLSRFPWGLGSCSVMWWV